MAAKVTWGNLGNTSLSDVNNFFVLLTKTSYVLPLHLRQTFPPIIWIFTEGVGDGMESRLPFKSFLLYDTHTQSLFIKTMTTFGFFWPLMDYVIKGDWVFSYLVWFWFWLVVLILVHPAPHLIWLFGLHLVPFFGGLAVWRTLFCVWLECGLFCLLPHPPGGSTDLWSRDTSCSL